MNSIIEAWAAGLGTRAFSIFGIAILILLEEKVEIKNLTPLAKEFFFKLKRLKHAQEFLPLPKFELKKFIKEKFLKEIAIEEKTLELLVEFLGNNLWLQENEINKLLS